LITNRFRTTSHAQYLPSYVRWLLEGLANPDNDEIRRLYKQSNRLCFDHLRQSLDKAIPASTAGLEILLADALETLKPLDSDLRGHISKYDYDKKAPRSEGEQFSWLRAIYFFTGRREGDNPKPEFSDSQTEVLNAESQRCRVKKISASLFLCISPEGRRDGVR